MLLLPMIQNQERLPRGMTDWQTQQQHHMLRISEMLSKHMNPSKMGREKFMVLGILPQGLKDEELLNSNQKSTERPISLH